MNPTEPDSTPEGLEPIPAGDPEPGEDGATADVPCCGPVEQRSCCEPDDKAECCGASPPGSCGCR